MKIKISAIKNAKLKEAARGANTHIKDDYIDEQEFSLFATKATQVLAAKQCTQADYTSLFGSTQSQTQIPKQEYIKPSVTQSNGKYKVKYQNSKGQQVSFTTDVPMVAEVYKQIRAYIDHGVTAEEQDSMTDAVYSSMGAHNNNAHNAYASHGFTYGYAKISYGSQLLDDYDRLMTKYSSEISEGGTTITVEEASKFMERWHNWTSKVTKADVSPSNTKYDG